MTKADIDNYLKTERELENQAKLILDLWQEAIGENGGVDRVEFNFKDGELEIVYRTPALFHGEHDGYDTFTCPIPYLYMTKAELVAERDRIWAKLRAKRRYY